MRGSTAISAASALPRLPLRDSRLSTCVRPSRTASCARRCRCRSSVVYTSTACVVVVVRPGILLGERLADEVDEVRRFGFERALDDDERLVSGAVGDVLRDVAGVDHRLQHDVAPLLAAGRVVERRQRRRRLEDAGDRRRFGQRHVADVLAEEQPRRLRHADDAERAALAERHVVQVHLEDRVLRRARRDDDRHPDLEQLAPQRLLARLLQRHARKHLRQEDVARHLLRDRAGAGGVARACRAMFDSTRADHADRIDAGMLVEAAILDREHRLRHARRDGGERHRPPLLALAAASEVSTGASSVSRSLALAPSSSRCTRSADARRRRLRRALAPVAARAAAGRRRGRSAPLSSGARGMIATAPLPIANSPGLLDARRAARSRDRSADRPAAARSATGRAAARAAARRRAETPCRARRAGARRSGARSGRSSRWRRRRARTTGIGERQRRRCAPSACARVDDPDRTCGRDGLAA